MNEMVLYSPSALQMVAVKKNQPLTVQNTNKTIRDAPNMSHQPVGVWLDRPAFRENINRENFF